MGDDARVYVTEFEARRAALLKIARMLARKINLENDRHPKWVFYRLTVRRIIKICRLTIHK